MPAVEADQVFRPLELGGRPPHVPSQAVDLEPDGSGGSNQR